MRPRKQALGNRNICGAHVEMARKSQGMKQCELAAKLQCAGIDISALQYSKLERQIRHVTDYELLALSDILGMPIIKLLGKE